MLSNCRCYIRLLRVPWTARRSNQSILNEIHSEYSPEGWSWSWNFNILTTSCEEPTHWKGPWCLERLRAEGEGNDRGWDGWMAGWHHWLDGHEFEQNLGNSEGQGSLVCCSSWVTKSQTQQWLNSNKRTIKFGQIRKETVWKQQKVSRNKKLLLRCLQLKEVAV